MTPSDRAGNPDDQAAWEGRLRRALRDERFVLYAQPIVELATGAVVQHELLIRIVDEAGELTMPAHFLPVAERCGLISEVDRWVVRQAASLVARGYAVQVNISGATMGDAKIGGYVERELAAVDAPAALIGFEITETALTESYELAHDFVTCVRSLGCRVALDDFGSGYGGFSYLKHLRVDSLKIDREFVSDLMTDRASGHVIMAIVQLAAGLELQTVAEGVEDHRTLEQLRSLGVDQVQGFYMARPAPAMEVLRRARPTAATI